jgi:RNA polymerase sigma-70 factor (ECF subfamily)
LVLEPRVPTEDQLVDAARQGDRQAFGQLVERHMESVARTIAGILGRTDEVDDVAQDVFIKFYDTLPNYRGDAAVETYLKRIALNKSLDMLRKIKRRRMKLVDADTVRADEAALSVDGNREIDDRETTRIVQKAIEELSPRHRAVVVLRMIEGYSTEQTAEILEVPYGTVLSRLNRAMDRLRVNLEPLRSRSIPRS